MVLIERPTRGSDDLGIQQGRCNAVVAKKLDQVNESVRIAAVNG